MTRKLIESESMRRKLPPMLSELFGATRPSAAAAAQPGRLVITMRCAVTDQDFNISFRANSLKPDIYFVERVAVAAERPGSSEASAPALQIPIRQLPFADLTCPHCQHATGPVKCGKCGQLVCMGRVEGDVFYCAKSCGASGVMGGALNHVTGHEDQTIPLLSRRSSAPQLTGPSMRMIERRKL